MIKFINFPKIDISINYYFSNYYENIFYIYANNKLKDYNT